MNPGETNTRNIKKNSMARGKSYTLKNLLCNYLPMIIRGSEELILGIFGLRTKEK